MQDNKKYTKKLTDKGTFLSAIITLTIVFIVVEFISFGLLNLQEYSSTQVSTNQVIVYLNDLDENTKNELSKKLVELPGVSSVRYESKEIALKAAVKELGVAVNEEENPLSDAFFVYINKSVKLDQLKSSLLNMPEISAIDFRTKALEQSLNFAKGIDSLTIKASSVCIVVGLFMIYNIVGLSIKSRKKEIHELLEDGVKPRKLKKKFFFESITTIFVSTILSFGIYQGIRQLLVNNIKQILPGYSATTSIIDEVIVAAILFVVAVIISLFISFFAMNRYFKISSLEKIIDKEEVEEKNEIEEIKNSENVDEKEEIESEEEAEDEMIGEDENENNWEV